MNLTLKLICEHINGNLLTGIPDMNIYSIGTDSRNINTGSLFFALKGENFDGHNYVIVALEKGALAAVISREVDLTPLKCRGKGIIKVNDTLQALQDLARYYRQLFDIPIIAVTGSVGKTTTKDLIYYCLKNSLRTMKTEGNFNNDIGLPLTILNLENEHQAAVVEMGMRGKGEISRLVDIAMPTCAVISSVENVHLETMGSLENIAEAKCEILNNLTEEQFALIDGDNEMLVQIASRYPCKVYTFGLNDNCDFRIDEINIDSMGMHLDLDLMGQYKRLYFTLPSRRLASNIAASVGAAFLLGIDIDSIASGLKAYHPSGNRMNITRFTEGGTLINDTYNANPLSMAAVLETGREMAREGRLVAVLGDMYELGDHEIGGHLEVGQKAFELDVDTLIAVGSLAEHIARGAIKAGMPVEKVNHFKDKNDSIKFLKQTFNKRDTIVFKASRGMKLETLVDELLK